MREKSLKKNIDIYVRITESLCYLKLISVSQLYFNKKVIKFFFDKEFFFFKD